MPLQTPLRSEPGLLIEAWLGRLRIISITYSWRMQMDNPKIEVSIADILKEIQSDQKINYTSLFPLTPNT